MSFCVVLAFFQTQLQYLWNVLGMCTPVSAAAAATSFGQREVCARQEEVLGISKESSFLCGGVQLQVFFSSLHPDGLSLSRKREMRQVVIF